MLVKIGLLSSCAGFFFVVVVTLLVWFSLLFYFCFELFTDGIFFLREVVDADE